MAESEVKSAALWLGKLLVEQISNLDGVRDQVADLQTELNSLAAFLIEAVKTRHQDQLVQNELSNARDIAYDCQDVIDTYILKVARHGYEEYKGCQLGSALRWACLGVNAVPVLEIHSEIDALNKRISALRKRMKGYGVSDRIIAADNNPAGRHLTRFYTHEREECVVVGFKNQLDELVERLLNPSKEMMIAICGMGGVGKSTLARELYHHPMLRDGGYFQAFGWAAASRQLQPDQVLRTLLYSLVPENDRENRGKIDEDVKAGRAHAALYNLMKDRKCLVVIDDIWTSNDWVKLQPAFPRKTATGSRIVLTTRNKETVSRLDFDVCLHSVEALNETQSWELFEKIAFPSASSCTDSNKKELGREMLQHCKGVPLAIVVLAKVLQRKQRVEDWKQLRNDISSPIQRGDAAGLYKEVYDVLQVSYDELPYYLKNCFLHLANFPEDYEIPTEKLYQLWVAEGIVSKEDPDELEEDTAERYLNELVSRSMVQAASWVKGTAKRIEKCSLHDLMRDVCIGISKREGFVQIVNCNISMLMKNNTNAAHPLISLPEIDKSLRRIAVYVSDQEPHSSSLSTSTSTAKVSRGPNLRSLLLFLSHWHLSPRWERQDENKCRKLVETICNDYPLLRVLDCENLCVTGMLPKNVLDLIHLKYLILANTWITKLPSSIETLKCLQTLDLRVEGLRRDVVFSLPNVLWKMKQLRHVYFPDKYSIKGGRLLRLDGLYNLQTLMNIDLDRLKADGLKMLKRRKMVSATCKTNEEALDHLIQGSSSIKFSRLMLHTQILNQKPTILSICEAMDYLLLNGELDGDRRLSQLCLEMLPQTLVHLQIEYVKLENDPLPVLKGIPSLDELVLYKCYDGQRMVCSAGGFPELTHLSFSYLYNFSDWEVEQGALLKLKTLVIRSCPVLKQLPDALPSSVEVIRD